MLKIKKRLVNLKSVILKLKKKKTSLKFKILIGASSLIIILMIYFSLSLILVSREDIVLAKLRNSYHFELSCHENCRLNREKEINKLIDLLKQENKKAEEKIKNIILNKEEEIEFKRELIKILGKVYGRENIPEYLKLYLEDTTAETTLQATIINSFTIEKNEELSTKYYFNLIDREVDLNLKLESINALSNIQNKKNSFSKAQIELIGKIILNQKTNNKLRASLIFLLNDFYPLFPIEAQKILKQIYNDKDIDKISKIFATDILNRYLKNNKLTAPEASHEEWSNYYNN